MELDPNVEYDLEKYVDLSGTDALHGRHYVQASDSVTKISVCIPSSNV